MKRMLTIICLGLAIPISLCANTRTPVYDPQADPYLDLAAATSQSASDQKLVLVIFGADWCPDCLMLEHHMQQEGLRQVIEQNFNVVKVDVGEKDKNLDFMARFGSPIAGGIPSIAIMDAQSKIHFVTTAGELASARSAKTESLKKWFQSVVKQIKQDMGDPAATGSHE